MTEFEIRPAAANDLEWIRSFGLLTRRPARQTIRWQEYFVAQAGQERVGCAAVERVGGGGYLYGLAVHLDHRRSGIGSALTQVRVERVRAWNGKFAAALAMFWNLRFFRSLGFTNVPKASLPAAVTNLPDFRNPKLRRSVAVLKPVTSPG
jgi:N-acetylglutamate synthase-like GNAT family acetyltransferase